MGPLVVDQGGGVWSRCTSYDVSVWPPGIECMDSDTWKITVEYRGRELWAVKLLSMCLGRDGEWDYESPPSGGADEWLSEHRFTLAEAMQLAREHAPGVTVNGLTAVEVLARHRARHPDGNCRR